MHTLDRLNRGGAETLALDVCRNAAAHDLEMTLVATGGGELEEEFRDSGVSYVRLHRRLPVDLILVAQLRRIIKERAVRIVHSYNGVDALHVYLATRGTNVKRVLSYQGYVRDLKNLAVLRFLAPRTHANIAVSRAFMEWLKREVKLDTDRNFHIIYNGVDAKRLPVANRKLRDELKLSGKEVLLGMVANFNVWKDQMTVCRALLALFAHAPHAHFAFIGGRSVTTPHLYDDCVRFCREQQFTKRTHFLGKRGDVPELLSSLDVFVLSSLVEGLPVALVEAMMAGVPAIVSDIAPSREVAGEGEYAILFETGNAEDLALKLGDLIADPEGGRERARAAQRMAHECFSIEAHMSALKELYRKVTEEPKQA